jgi:hypothetical protein
MLDICKNLRDIIDPTCNDEKLEKFVNGYASGGYIDLGHPFLCEYGKLANVLMIVIDTVRPYKRRGDLADTCVEMFKKDERLNKIHQDMVIAMLNAYNEGVIYGQDKRPGNDGE